MSVTLPCRDRPADTFASSREIPAALFAGGAMTGKKGSSEVFSASLWRVHGDDGLAARARAAAPGLRTRGQRDSAHLAVAAVAELA